MVWSAGWWLTNWWWGFKRRHEWDRNRSRRLNISWASISFTVHNKQAVFRASTTSHFILPLTHWMLYPFLLWMKLNCLYFLSYSPSLNSCPSSFCSSLLQPQTLIRGILPFATSFWNASNLGHWHVWVFLQFADAIIAYIPLDWTISSLWEDWATISLTVLLSTNPTFLSGSRDSLDLVAPWACSTESSSSWLSWFR